MKITRMTRERLSCSPSLPIRNVSSIDVKIIGIFYEYFQKNVEFSVLRPYKKVQLNDCLLATCYILPVLYRRTIRKENRVDKHGLLNM